MNFNNIYQCYILGLLWGDGYMSKHPRDTTRFAGIRIETVLDDSIIYQDILNKSEFNYCISNRKRDNRKPSQRLSINSVPLTVEFVKYNYHLKSQVSPNELIANIPKENLNYWYRGFFDADGSVSSQRGNDLRITHAGSYNQDWSFLENLLKELDSKYSCYKQISKLNHKHSRVVCTSNESSKKFLDYIYQGEIFGLDRKRNKISY